MAEQLSTASKIIRFGLILILVVMIGAFVYERRAANAAKAAFEHASLVAKDKRTSEVLQKEIGRKPDSEQTNGNTRTQRYLFKGLIRNYTVRVEFNVGENADAGEEAHLEVFDKLKGQSENMETAAKLPSVQ